MIREATLDDVSQLLEMGKHFLAQTAYGHRLGTNVEQMAKTAVALIDQDNGVVFVVAQGTALLGMIGVLRFQHHLSGEPVAAEVFWWVEPEARGVGVRLMKRAEAWAKAHGAVRFQMVSPEPKVGQLYERMGYQAIEVAYERTL